MKSFVFQLISRATKATKIRSTKGRKTEEAVLHQEFQCIYTHNNKPEEAFCDKLEHPTTKQHILRMD